VQASEGKSQFGLRNKLLMYTVKKCCLNIAD